MGKRILHKFVDGSRADLCMEGSSKCQALHSLIRIVVYSGVRRECGRNFGSERLQCCVFVFVFSFICLFFILCKLDWQCSCWFGFFFLIAEVKKKSYAWISTKSLCFHMQSFHSDLCKEAFSYFERKKVFFLT